MFNRFKIKEFNYASLISRMLENTEEKGGRAHFKLGNRAYMDGPVKSPVFNREESMQLESFLDENHIEYKWELKDGAAIYLIFKLRMNVLIERLNASFSDPSLAETAQKIQPPSYKP